MHWYEYSFKIDTNWHVQRPDFDIQNLKQQQQQKNRMQKKNLWANNKHCLSPIQPGV